MSLEDWIERACASISVEEALTLSTWRSTVYRRGSWAGVPHEGIDHEGLILPRNAGEIGGVHGAVDLSKGVEPEERPDHDARAPG